MNIALCYDQVMPARGGCATYIADLARRLLADGHEVHLYAGRYDEQALPAGLQYHLLPLPGGPRCLRPWRFGRSCLEALQASHHDVSMGFDKTWGQDVLYPQGGLHVASVDYNLHKFSSSWQRRLAQLGKSLDLAHWSYCLLERRQYLTPPRPQIIVNSFLVQKHFQHYYGIDPQHLHVVRSAIDPRRFPETDRPKRRLARRQQWGVTPTEAVGLFAAINYRLKGLEPLLYALQRLRARAEFRHKPPAFRLVVAGHPRTGSYQRLAMRLGVADHLCFIGHCPDMHDAYFAADFLVHPTFYDPCSLVVLEALACGLPVITTRANGASELLHPLQEGYVLDDPHEHDHLAWCLLQLLDPARRAACAQAARRTATQWTFEHHYRQLLRVLSLAAQKKLAA